MYNCIACCISWCVSYNLQTVNERLSAYRSASPPAKAKGETSTIYETSKVRRYERERASLKWKGGGGARGGASVVTVTWFQGVLHLGCSLRGETGAGYPRLHLPQTEEIDWFN